MPDLLASAFQVQRYRCVPPCTVCSATLEIGFWCCLFFFSSPSLPYLFSFLSATPTPPLKVELKALCMMDNWATLSYTPALFVWFWDRVLLSCHHVASSFSWVVRFTIICQVLARFCVFSSNKLPEDILLWWATDLECYPWVFSVLTDLVLFCSHILQG